MKPRSARAALCLTALVATSCGDELDAAWKVNNFRILAAPIENLDRVETPAVTDAAPGERVRLQLITADDRDPPRAFQVVWVFCSQVARTGNTFGCAPEGASIQMGADVTYQVPANLATSIDTQGRPRIQALAIACTGTLAVDPATMLPSCTGEGAVSWTMTRSILVRLPADTEPSNHNPEITEVVLYRGGPTSDPVVLDPATPLRIPRCTTDPCLKYGLEVRVRDGSREPNTTLNSQAQTIMSNERLVFGFYTTAGTLDGSFRVDSNEVPDGPIRNTIEGPTAAATARMWFSAQDTRGGVTVTSRTVIFE